MRVERISLRCVRCKGGRRLRAGGGHPRVCDGLAVTRDQGEAVHPLLGMRALPCFCRRSHARYALARMSDSHGQVHRGSSAHPRCAFLRASIAVFVMRCRIRRVRIFLILSAPRRSIIISPRKHSHSKRELTTFSLVFFACLGLRIYPEMCNLQALRCSDAPLSAQPLALHHHQP